MLKLGMAVIITRNGKPAAFRRLCVETFPVWDTAEVVKPAAFRRLCVETL